MTAIYSQVIDCDFHNYDGFKKLADYELRYFQLRESGGPGFSMTRGEVTLSGAGIIECTRKLKIGRNYRITLKNAVGKGLLIMGIDDVKHFDNKIPKDVFVELKATADMDGANIATFSFRGIDDEIKFSGYKIEYI
ncbi:hypothetical protein ACWWJF_07060 [Symbiopectobacterium sp. Eva_TO]